MTAALLWLAGALLGPSALGGEIEFDPSCWSVVDAEGFLVRGERDSARPGARLWHLDRLKAAWTRAGTDSCTAAVYEQALKDQAEYWRHIGTKYGCEGNAPNAEKCELVEGNNAFLRFALYVAQAPRGSDLSCLQREYAGRSFETVEALGRDLNDIVNFEMNDSSGTQPEEACAGIDPSELRENAHGGRGFLGGALSCGMRLVGGVLRSLVDVARTAASMMNLSFFSAASTMIREAGFNPLKILRNIVVGLADYFTEELQVDFACLSTQAKVDRICAWVGKLTGNFAVLPRLAAIALVKGMGMGSRIAGGANRAMTAVMSRVPMLRTAANAVRSVGPATVGRGAAGVSRLRRTLNRMRRRPDATPLSDAEITSAFRPGRGTVTPPPAPVPVPPVPVPVRAPAPVTPQPVVRSVPEGAQQGAVRGADGVIYAPGPRVDVVRSGSVGSGETLRLPPAPPPPLALPPGPPPLSALPPGPPPRLALPPGPPGASAAGAAADLAQTIAPVSRWRRFVGKPVKRILFWSAFTVPGHAIVQEGMAVQEEPGPGESSRPENLDSSGLTCHEPDDPKVEIGRRDDGEPIIVDMQGYWLGIAPDGRVCRIPEMDPIIDPALLPRP